LLFACHILSTVFADIGPLLDHFGTKGTFARVKSGVYFGDGLDHGFVDTIIADPQIP
jgi:hypothetical protein